jgi:hypothetical protein
MASGISTVVENLTQSHKFEGSNLATAFIGGRKKKKKSDSQLVKCSSTMVEDLTQSHKFEVKFKSCHSFNWRKKK